MTKTVKIIGVTDEDPLGEADGPFQLIQLGAKTFQTPTLSEVREAIAQYHTVLAWLSVIEKELSERTLV